MADLVGKLFLKYSPVFSGLRRIPWVGGAARRFSRSILAADQTTWVQVQNGPGKGLWLKLHPRTGQDYYEGSVEPGLQKVLADCLQPGMVVYDLGANLGFFSLLAARLVCAGGKVFSFEADPEVALRLQEHVAKNEFNNVEVIRQAVWSSTGTIAFGCADESRSPDRGLGRVVSSPTVPAATIQVPCTTLDDFAMTKSPPDFIKCDVEDAESDVFAGGQRVLEEHRPLVACETHSERSVRELTALFGTRNYSLDWFTKIHFLASPRFPK